MMYQGLELHNEGGICREKLKSDPLSSQQLDTFKNRVDGHSFTFEDLIKKLEEEDKEGKDDLWYIIEAQVITQKYSWGNSLLKYVINSLEVRDGKWDLSKVDMKHQNAYYYRLRVLYAILSTHHENTEIEGYMEENIINIMQILAVHVHPGLPWTSPMNSSLAKKAIEVERIKILSNRKMDSLLRDFFFPLFPLYKNVNSSKLTSAGYSRKGGYLKSKLSQSGINITNAEEEVRARWKDSSSAKSLSVIYYMIYISKDSSWLDSNWSVITSSILKIFDDPEIQYKIEACNLLCGFLDILGNRASDLLSKTGLLKIFVESCTTCFSFLPSFTSEDVSLRLMERAYPVYFSLSKSQEYLEIMEVLNVLLSSISHIQGNQSATRLLSFLLDQLCKFVDILGPKFLIPLSKVNFLVNQILTDPYLVDVSWAPMESCLKIHEQILKLFVSLDNAPALDIIFAYRYDILGATCVILRRNPVPKIVRNTQSNLFILATIAKRLSQQETFQHEINQITSERPDMKPYLTLENHS